MDEITFQSKTSIYPAGFWVSEKRLQRLITFLNDNKIALDAKKVHIKDSHGNLVLIELISEVSPEEAEKLIAEFNENNE